MEVAALKEGCEPLCAAKDGTACVVQKDSVRVAAAGWPWAGGEATAQVAARLHLQGPGAGHCPPPSAAVPRRPARRVLSRQIARTQVPPPRSCLHVAAPGDSARQPAQARGRWRRPDLGAAARPRAAGCMDKRGPAGRLLCRHLRRGNCRGAAGAAAAAQATLAHVVLAIVGMGHAVHCAAGRRAPHHGR